MLINHFLLAAKKVEKRAPEFLKSLPKEKVLEVGDDVTLEVEVSGEPMPEVKWLKNDKPLKESDRIKSEVKGNIRVITIKDVDLDDDALYSCCITNDSGSVTCQCEIFIDEPEFAPKFIEELESLSIEPGDEAEFAVKVHGNPEPKVEWYHNDKQVKDRGRYQLLIEKAGQYILVIDNCKESDSGHVKCVAVSAIGDTSCSATLDVQGEIVEKEPEPELQSEPVAKESEPERSETKLEAKAELKTSEAEPPIIKEISSTSLDVPEGEDIRLEVEVTGNPAPKFEWLRGFKKVLELNDKLTIEREDTKSVLIIKNAKLTDADTYKCVALNKCGRASKNFTVNVTKGKWRS